MRLVLDTSVLIAGDPPPDEAEVAVSSVTFAELSFGIGAAPSASERALRQARFDRLRDELGPGLPFDDKAAVAFGSVTALVTAAGRNPRARALDLMIAATAYTNGAGMFTRNASDLAGLETLLAVLEP